MLNKSIIMGRLTAEPELKHTQSNNISVVSFTVAVERSFSGKDGKRETDFLDVVAWRNTAEFIAKYFSKGQMIAIVGSIQARTWEDKEGKKRKAVEVIADEVSFCGSKQSGASDNSSGVGYCEPVSVDDSFHEVSPDAELPF